MRRVADSGGTFVDQKSLHRLEKVEVVAMRRAESGASGGGTPVCRYIRVMSRLIRFLVPLAPLYRMSTAVEWRRY